MKKLYNSPDALFVKGINVITMSGDDPFQSNVNDNDGSLENWTN